MTGKGFLNAAANDKADVVQAFLHALAELGVDYCVIGGFAVNAYVEPVVSLDLDVVIAAEDIDRVCDALEKEFRIEQFDNCLSLTSSQSDIRIQVHTDGRYRDFLRKATVREVLGYQMRVAALADVLQGKIWAYSDTERRASKRQKDLADIFRIAESHPVLEEVLPLYVRQMMK